MGEPGNTCCLQGPDGQAAVVLPAAPGCLHRPQADIFQPLGTQNKEHRQYPAPLPQLPAQAALPGASPATSARGGDGQGAQRAGSCPPPPARGCSATRLGPKFACCQPQGAARVAAGVWLGSGCEQGEPASSSTWFFKVTEVVGRKEKRARKKKLTQKPQGIFCLFRILGREKIATVIQSIRDNNSLFTVCMQRWQARSTAQGRGMRNLLLSRHGPTASA